MNVTCPSCGADNYDSARYCRKCGLQLGGSEFHEATTRSLEQKRQPEAPPLRAPDTFGSAPLANEPARYMPPAGSSGGAALQRPAMTVAPMYAGTAPMRPGERAKKTNWFLIVGVIFVAILLGGGIFGIIVAHKIGNAIATAKKDGGGVDFGNGKGAGVELHPDASKLPTDLKAWVYEGADIEVLTQGSFGPVGGTVLTMKTDDDPKRVADFYRKKFSKLRNKSEVHDNEDNSFVFSAPGVNVVVSPPDAGDEDEMTNIVVSLGGVSGMPGGGDVPEPPTPPSVDPGTIPTPPPPPPVPSAPGAKK